MPFSVDRRSFSFVFVVFRGLSQFLVTCRGLLCAGISTLAPPSVGVCAKPQHFFYRPNLQILVSTRHELEKGSSGNTVNLVSNDAAKMEKSVFALGMLITAVFEVTASICVLWLLIGLEALVGAAFFVLVVIYVILVSRSIATLQKKASRFTDRRLALMNEIISGIRTIKMSTFESIFTDGVRQTRGYVTSGSLRPRPLRIITVEKFNQNVCRTGFHTAKTRTHCGGSIADAMFPLKC